MGLDALLQGTLRILQEGLEIVLLLLDLLHLLLGVGRGLGAGFGREQRVLGLLVEFLVLVNEGLALLADFLGLFLRLLLGVAELGVGFLGFVVGVKDLGHIDHDQFHGRLRAQGGGTDREGGQGQEGADHLVHNAMGGG